MSTVCETLQVARSNITARVADRPKNVEDDHPYQMLNWCPKYKLLLLSFQLMAIAASMRFCVVRRYWKTSHGRMSNVFTGL